MVKEAVIGEWRCQEMRIRWGAYLKDHCPTL